MITTDGHGLRQAQPMPPWIGQQIAALQALSDDQLRSLSERLLMLHDAPLLEQSLKTCAGALIRPPKGTRFSPDRDPLAAGFEQFEPVA